MEIDFGVFTVNYYLRRFDGVRYLYFVSFDGGDNPIISVTADIDRAFPFENESVAKLIRDKLLGFEIYGPC